MNTPEDLVISLPSEFDDWDYNFLLAAAHTVLDENPLATSEDLVFFLSNLS